MEKNKKIPYIHILPLIIIAIVLYKIIDIPFSLSVVLEILRPFFIAFALAYLLNPMVKYLEKSFKLNRNGSIFFTYLIVLGAVTFIITIVTPNIIESIGNLVTNTPDYIRKAQKYIQYNVTKFEILSGTQITQSVESLLRNFLLSFSGFADTAVNEVLKQAINVTAILLKLIISIVISIYMLKDKENFKRQIKRFIYAVFDYNNSKKIINLGIEIDHIFTKYLIGKFIDSLIIGTLGFIILALIVRAPYSLLLSVIIGITNMIPYFGPFIGAVPAIIITLFIAPIKAIWVAVAILGLQQFDGLYLGPKILGDHVGVKPFWIISAITIGGAMFGFVGMLLGVPVIAVLRLIMVRFIDRRLKNNNINI